MAQVVRQQLVEAYVGYHAFGLQESDDADLPVAFPDEFDFSVTLAESGGSWRVRVSCVGRAEAAALSEGDGTGVGVERYLIQFWPANT